MIKPLIAVTVLGLYQGLCWADAHIEASIGQYNTSLQQGSNDLLSMDEQDIGFNVQVGYELDKGVAVTLGYIDQGDASAILLTDTLTPAQYHQRVSTVTPVLADGFTLGAEVAILTDERWQLDGEVGLFIWEADITSQASGHGTLRTVLDGEDIYLGLKARYFVSEQWAANVGVRHYRMREDVNSVNVGVSWHF